MSSLPAHSSPPAPPQKKRQKDTWFLAGVGLVLMTAVAGVGWFGYLLFRGPQAKPMTDLRETVKERQAAATSAKKSAPAKPAAAAAPGTVEKSQPVQAPSLAQIAKIEAARQSTPGGPLYDDRSRDVALSFEGLAVDAPPVAEAQEVLAKYLKAASWRERLPFVFEPERVEPLMQEQCEKRQMPDPDCGSLLGGGIITAGTSRVINLQFTCNIRPEAGLRANFHQTRGGKLLLDWESWAAWSERTWPEFKKERSPAEVVMRAVASESDYYNYEFSEKWRWLAVKLRSADGLHTVTGYIQRNTTLGVALANLIGVPIPHNLPSDAPMPALKPPGSKSLVTLRLRFPLNAQSDSCVMITDMLADRWLLFPGEERSITPPATLPPARPIR